MKFNNRFARLPSRFYTKLNSDPPQEPVAAHLNPEGAKLIGFEGNVEAALPWLGGYELLEGMEPLASVYAGHQFGHFVPQLGDGRALILGEAVGPNGSFELNLKGGGRTPYSRQGDGRAVIRSTVREYLISEAFAGLGIPTTRSLGMVTTNAPVRRETMERAATMIRLAPSFIRFGHFEFFHNKRDFEAVEALTDFVIRQHMPEVAESREPTVLFYYEVVRRTAELMAQWMAAGWIHGVMNTDNMSILGLTIDYGPYGFLDDFIPNRVWNHTDEAGRYAYNQQAGVGFWNLKALGHALSSVLGFEPMDYILGQYNAIYRSKFAELMARRLGLAPFAPEDAPLLNAVLERLNETGADYHHTLRDLYYALSEEAAPEGWTADFKGVMGADLWARLSQRWQQNDREKVIATVRTSNPLYVLRNHHLDEVIQAVEKDDLSLIDEWLAVLKNPFELCNSSAHLWRAPLTPETGACLSCSS